MAKTKDPFEQVELYAKLLSAYNRLLENTVESRLFSDRNKTQLQEIHRLLSKVSTLIEEMK